MMTILKYTAVIFFTLVAIFVGLVTIGVSSMGIGLVADWVNKAELGVNLEHSGGGLFSGAQFSQIRIDLPSFKGVIHNVEVNAESACLISLSVCIKHIKVGRADLALVANSNEDTQDKTPTESITLPIPVSISVLSINNLMFRYSDTQHIDVGRISSSLALFKTLKVGYLDIQDLQHFDTTPLTPSKPFNFTDVSDYTFEPIVLPFIQLPINADISRLKVDNTCLHSIDDSGTLMPQQCVNSVVAQLNVRKETVTLSKLSIIKDRLEIKGNVMANFGKSLAVSSDLTVAYQQRNYDLALSASTTQFEGLVSQNGIDMLNLLADYRIDTALLPINASLTFNGNKLSEAFASELPVTMVGVQVIEVDGDLNAYQIKSSLGIESYYGIEKLTVDIVGDTEKIDVQSILLSGDIGEIELSGKAIIDQDVLWQGDVVLHDIALEEIESTLQSSLSGKVPTMARYDGEEWLAAIKNVQVQGKWQSYPFLIKGSANINNELEGEVNKLQVVIDSNNLAANGFFSLRDSSELNIALAAPDLSQLYAKLSGSFSAKGSIKGDLRTPSIDASLSGDSITIADFAVEELNGNVRTELKNRLTTLVNLNANGVTANNNKFDTVNVKVDGDAFKHSLSINVDSEKYKMTQQFDGLLSLQDMKNDIPILTRVMNAQKWDLLWATADIDTPYIKLGLDKSPTISISPKAKTIAATAFCLEGNGDSLCIDSFTYSPKILTTQFILEYYPLKKWVVEFIPELNLAESKMQVGMRGNATWTSTKGLNLRSEIKADNTEFAFEEATVEVPELLVNITGENDKFTVASRIDSPQAGVIDFKSNITLLPDAKHEIIGSLQVTDARLGAIKPFAPSLEVLKGKINANVDFTHNADNPDVNGKFTIVDGELVTSAYPVPLTKMQATIEFLGSQATVDSSFLMGGGEGAIKGSASLFATPELTLNVTGNELLIDYQDAYKVKVSPNLTAQLVDNKFNISGDLTIPYSRIKIKALPESAISASSDVVIIDKKAEPEVLGPQVIADINILIDPNKAEDVKIDALDLRANLSGQLHVQVNKSTKVNGSITLGKGTYKAYGQDLIIQEGVIAFDGSPSVPTFSIRAIRDPKNTADNVTVGVQVIGNAIEPQVSLFSQPSMEQSQQLYYLLRGEGINGKSKNDEGNDVALLNTLVNFGVGKSEKGVGSIGQKIGIEDLALETAGQGADTQVRISGNLAPGVKISYGVGVFDSTSEVAVKYQLLPQLYIQAISGVNSALDLFYQVSSKD